MYADSEANKSFADSKFPFVLSTEWTGVFDKELQALLGLCSLCAFLYNRTDDCSLSLPVCPITFILYLKLRCTVEQSDYWQISVRDTNYKDVSVTKLEKEYQEHRRNCRTWVVCRGHNVVTTAYNNFVCKLLRTNDS